MPPQNCNSMTDFAVTVCAVFYNEWFETQDSISYWEDFSKPKIVWKIIGNQMAFAYDANNYVMNNACYIMTGDHLDYLLAVLNFPITEVTFV
ncbi:hypothetical protein NCY79_10170 [Bacteroides uniformis]|nr:TaqI-like C-terminal specificity domain-containing protein [Bacteroides uniformis]MCM1956206.1 hypothetical protein [Bacteroides uniformis]